MAELCSTDRSGRIRRNARAQTQLVDDLLDVSWMTIGKLRLNRRPVAFDEIVEGAVDSIGPVAAAKGISVVVHAPRSSSFVLGDSHRLQQIVWNLLSNAVKFTPDGVDMVTAALTEVGAEVVPSFSASEAIERVRGGGIDLIVSDLAMPQEDGYAFIRKVRGDLASRIPAIALTARVGQEDRAQALASGFQLRVPKPVLPIDLVLAVAHLLQQPAI
jgi:CheY-like chemotaxis protein